MRIPRVRRRWLIAGPLAAAAGLAGWWLVRGDSSVPAPVEPGAYVYATDGFEEVGVLGGARHAYPTTTGISVRRSGCGRWLVWRPLRDRSTAYELCGGRLRSIHEVHQFFGRRDERTYRCEPGSSLRHGWRCSFEDTTELARGGIVGTGRIRGFAAVHVKLDTQISGDTNGTGTRDFWLRRSDDLPLRVRVGNDNSTGSPVGTVRYRERYELELELDAGRAAGERRRGA